MKPIEAEEKKKKRKCMRGSTKGCQQNNKDRVAKEEGRGESE